MYGLYWRMLGGQVLLQRLLGPNLLADDESEDDVGGMVMMMIVVMMIMMMQEQQGYAVSHAIHFL